MFYDLINKKKMIYDIWSRSCIIVLFVSHHMVKKGKAGKVYIGFIHEIKRKASWVEIISINFVVWMWNESLS